MTGLMMDYPLTLTHILERAAKIYPRREIASRVHDGSMHRYTYRDFIGAFMFWRTRSTVWVFSPATASAHSAGTAIAIWSYISRSRAPDGAAYPQSAPLARPTGLYRQSR